MTEQAAEIEKYCQGVKTIKPEDVDMAEMNCICKQRCPKNWLVYVFFSLLWVALYTGLWFLIIYQVKGEIKMD